jgi:hypothetical protein
VSAFCHVGFGHPGLGHPGLGHPGLGHPGLGHPGLGHPGSVRLRAVRPGRVHFGSVHQGADLLHFLLDAQLLDFESHEGFGIGSGSLVFVEDTHLEGGMPLLQGIETGMQAHERMSSD